MLPALLAVSRAVAGPVSVLTAGPGAGAGAGGAGARLGDTFCEPMDMDVGDDLIRGGAYAFLRRHVRFICRLSCRTRDPFLLFLIDVLLKLLNSVLAHQLISDTNGFSFFQKYERPVFVRKWKSML